LLGSEGEVVFAPSTSDSRPRRVGGQVGGWRGVRSVAMILATSRRMRAFARPAVRSIASVAEGPRWEGVTMAPADPILGVTDAWRKDTNPNKINLGVGAYRDDNGEPVVLKCVRKAEYKIKMMKHNMEYLGIAGLPSFINNSLKLAYGPDEDLSKIAAVQSLSGTGSCRLMADFMHRYAPNEPMHVPTPTWSNHFNIFADAGVTVKKMPYYDATNIGLDMKNYYKALTSIPENGFVMFHACAHNPTGVDPNKRQWKKISELCKERNLFPFFDMAYQGFASGDCEKDRAAIAMFIADGNKVGISQSYAKNMGLYGQRVGCFSIMCEDADEKKRVESQIKMIARPMYSNPPLAGALIVDTVLSDEKLAAQWHREVRGMAVRIKKMRKLLRAELEKRGVASTRPNGDWQHVTSQIGMFCYSGMTAKHVQSLAKNHSIYMTENGRISMAGVTSNNVERLADAMKVVMAEKP